LGDRPGSFDQVGRSDDHLSALAIATGRSLIGSDRRSVNRMTHCNGGAEVEFDDEYHRQYREIVRKMRAHPKPELKLIHGDMEPGSSKAHAQVELKVIQGSRIDAMWCRLMLEPESLTFEEFEFYTEVVFREFLTPSDEMEMMERRSSYRVRTDPSLEAKLLQAILVSDMEESNRLSEILIRRNALNLKVINGKKR